MCRCARELPVRTSFWVCATRGVCEEENVCVCVYEVCVCACARCVCVCVCVRALFHIQNGLLRRIQLV